MEYKNPAYISSVKVKEGKKTSTKENIFDIRGSWGLLDIVTEMAVNENTEKIIYHGILNGSNDNLHVYLWDWDISNWIQVVTIYGQQGNDRAKWSVTLPGRHNFIMGKSLKMRFLGVDLTRARLRINRFEWEG